MKIIAVDNNYLSATQDRETTPAWYLLTHSCLLRDNHPLYIPDWDNDFRIYPSMAIRIDRLGKSIPERFAHRYWDHYSFGFSLRGMQTYRQLSQHGLPVGEAVAFDNSAIIAGWQPIENKNLGDMEFVIKVDGKEVYNWRCANLALGVDAILSHLSSRMTFKTGDILYLGFSNEGIPISEGTTISVAEKSQQSDNKDFSSFKIK